MPVVTAADVPSTSPMMKKKMKKKTITSTWPFPISHHY